MKNRIANKISDFFVNYFTLSKQLIPQSDAEQSIRDDVSFHGTNIMILILAILIASLGLNTNSTAVIIGAMLISPLMGPIIGIGLGVGIHDFELIKRALRNLLMAAGFSILASTVFFMISPVGEGHSELLARTSPTIYDVLIGFVGGGAGILAIGSRSKGKRERDSGCRYRYGIDAAALHGRLRARHLAAELFLRSVISFHNQFDLHSVRHVHRMQAFRIQERGGGGCGARP